MLGAYVHSNAYSLIMLCNLNGRALGDAHCRRYTPWMLNGHPLGDAHCRRYTPWMLNGRALGDAHCRRYTPWMLNGRPLGGWVLSHHRLPSSPSALCHRLPLSSSSFGSAGCQKHHRQFWQTSVIPRLCAAMAANQHHVELVLNGARILSKLTQNATGRQHLTSQFGWAQLLLRLVARHATHQAIQVSQS